MKKKQLLGMLAAALAFVFVCGMSMLFRSWTQQAAQESAAGLSQSMETLLSAAGTYYDAAGPYVGILPIQGTIQASDSTSALFSGESYNHQAVLSSIDEMEASPDNRGILLLIDSGGGTVYESDEVYLRLLRYKQQTGRPVWAYFESQACSGAYYIACAADRILANRNCWTGSIGVIVQLMNLEGLYEKLGVEEIDITSGANKAMGSSGVELTQQQREILQGLVDEAYQQFVEIVARGRGLSEETVKSLADGRIYSARQARENGLVDGVCSYDEATEEMARALGEETQFCSMRQTDALLSRLLNWSASRAEKSDAQILTEYLRSNGRGELLYYAD